VKKKKKEKKEKSRSKSNSISDNEYVLAYPVKEAPLHMAPRVPSPKKQTITYSPAKLLNDQIIKVDDNEELQSLFEPRSLRDATDGSYWTVIRVINSLKPTLSLEDPKFITLKLINVPPTHDEMNFFPQQLIAAFNFVDNRDILDEETSTHIVEYKIYPPETKRQFARKIHKAGDPPHHVIIHWRPMDAEEESTLRLF